METNLNSATELSAMDLNNIKLDIKHTILTPQYLEDLIKAASNKNTASADVSDTPKD